jgi:outer membrane protein
MKGSSQVLLLLPLLSAQDAVEATAQDPATLQLNLEEAVRLALTRNLELKIVEIQGEVSHFDQLGSWGAFDWVFDASIGLTDAEVEVGGFLDGGTAASVDSDQTDYRFSFLRPITTGGSFSANFNRGVSDSTSAFQNDPEQTTDTLSLVYTQPLMRGAWSQVATATQRESELLWRRQLEVVRQTRHRIALQVSEAYWNLVSAFEQLEVARSGVSLGQSRLQREERELDAGLGTEVDVVQAQAELATRHETLLRTQNDVAQRQDELSKLLSAGEEDALWEVEVEPTTGLPEVVSTEGVPDWTTAVTIAYDKRPELRQKHLDLNISRLRMTRAESDRRAGLDLQLSVNSRAVDGNGSTSFEDTAAFEFPTYAASISYNVPIQNRTARFAERSARALVRSAQLDFDKTELDIAAEVRAAVRAVNYAAEQVVATAESLRLARKQLEAEEALKRNDLSTTFQVLEFQQALIEAMSNERTSRAGFAKALVALDSAQGLLGE